MSWIDVYLVIVGGVGLVSGAALCMLAIWVMFARRDGVRRRETDERFPRLGPGPDDDEAA